MEFVICNDDGYLDFNGCFGDIDEAIIFNHFQVIAINNATGLDYVEYEEAIKDDKTRGV